MSAFGYYEKDNISDSIISFIEYKRDKSPEMCIGEIVREVLEAVGYAVENSIWNIENNKK